jgi:hypothetical protein
MKHDPFVPKFTRWAEAGKTLLWSGVVITIALLVLASCSGCVRNPGIRLKGSDKFGGAKDLSEVFGPKDPGTPATALNSGSKTTVPLPAGSEVTWAPAQNVESGMVGVKLSGPSEIVIEQHSAQASTGTIDVATAQHRIDKETAAKERKPLLWAAIGAVAAGVVCMVMRWPSAAVLAFIAAGAFFAAWKLAEVPWWAGVLAVVAGAFLVLGYKRAEWDKNKDWIPDKLQK